MATRQLAAIMFTDMVGYTALMQENEHLALEKRRWSKTIYDDSLSKHIGTLLQHYGDGTLSINNSGVNAILCAIEMQTQSRQQKIDLRIGIHIGDILKDDNGIYGDSVNVAARIESLAVPGSIFISEKLYDDIKNHDSIHAKTLGYFELKNVKQPIQVFAITNKGILVPSRDEVKGKIKETPNSIAVLPFTNVSSDPENEFFCDGITEELLNVISRIEGLQVISRTSAFAFKGSKEDIREIGAKLNVRRILEGSVRKAGNKVRITAKLVNATDGYHLWSETYDRSIEDIFAVQDEISRAIANKLRVNLSTAEHESQLVTAPTDNLEAYKKYLEGLHHWHKQTLQSTVKALDCFEEAVRMEPEFAMPYSNIVFACWFLGYTGMIELKTAEDICRRASENAIKYDPSNPFSLLSVGISKMMYDWNWNEAYNAFQNALAINSNVPMAYIMLAWYHIVMLEYDNAIASVKTALRYDPMGGDTNAALAEIYLLSGRFDEALDTCEQALMLEPHSMYALHIKAMAIGFKGNWLPGIAILSEILNRAKDIPITMASLGICYAGNGEIEKAKEIIRRLEEIQEQKPGVNLSFQLALLYLHVEDMENFYKYYEFSIRTKAIGSMFRYGTPFLKNIRMDKRLIELRNELDVPY
ncbi:MAG: tetratricopeptide repeat protein [Saprospiraceae bacterium]